MRFRPLETARRIRSTTSNHAGMFGKAAELLETGYGNFVNEPFQETDEFSNTAPDRPRTGPMFANIALFLTTLLYGYPGLRLGPGEPDTWSERPVVLPAGWKAIHVERLWVCGEGRSLSAVAGAPAAILDGRRAPQGVLMRRRNTSEMSDPGDDTWLVMRGRDDLPGSASARRRSGSGRLALAR